MLVDTDSDFPEITISSGKRPDARRKAARPPEPVASASTSVANGSADGDVVEVARPANASSRPRRTRQPPKRQMSPPITIKPDPDGPSSKIDLLHPPASSASSKRKANGTGATRGQKPVTPPTARDPKPEATPTLKIRLPRIGAFSPATPVVSTAAMEASKASPTKMPVTSSTSTSGRPRRSGRGRGSISASMNPASISEAGSSSRTNDAGVSVSPIESF